jgi:hypothetical protein
VTTLQILSVAAPIWAAAVVMLVVWIESYFDQREMLRENLAGKPAPSPFSELRATETGVPDVPEGRETRDQNESLVSSQTLQQSSVPSSGIAEQVAKPTLISDADERLRSIIATLDESRSALVESLNTEAAQVLAVSILQLRMASIESATKNLHNYPMQW